MNHFKTSYEPSIVIVVIVVMTKIFSSQVSNQCMALAREKFVVPTKDAPELGYVIESSPNLYVPDVIFKEKDDYGNEVRVVRIKDQ